MGGGGGANAKKICRFRKNGIQGVPTVWQSRFTKLI
jgi:hypothetical protein